MSGRQHPAAASATRTARHPARSIYTPDHPGSYGHQRREYLERCGLMPDIDERLEGWEQDLQDDLGREATS